MKLSKEQKELAKKLRHKQLAFANLIALQDENKLSEADCYFKAGYKVNTTNAAAVCATKLLKNVNVRAYIDSLKLSASNSAGLTLEFLDKKLMSMIETNIDDFAFTVEHVVETDDGPVTIHTLAFKEDIQKLPENVRGSINSVKMTKDGIQYNLPCKKALIELAYKRIGGLVEKRELTGKDGQPLSTQVILATDDPVVAARAYQELMGQ